MAKVLFTGTGYENRHFASIEQAGHQWCFLEDSLNYKALSVLVTDVHGYVLGGDEFVDTSLLDLASQLRAISFVGVGYQNFIDAEAAKVRGISLLNTPGATSNAVAEATIGLIIAARRRLFWLNDLGKAGHSGDLRSADLTNATVGIIGLGSIGQAVASFLRLAFNMRVIYWSRSRKQDAEVTFGLEFITLDKLAFEADIVVTCMASEPETVGIINVDFLSNCRNGVIIVNPASHKLIDHNAMCESLISEKVSCFAQDDVPSVSDVPAVVDLQKMGNDRVILLPHATAKTPGSWNKTLDQAVENILKALSGVA
ncbi:MAG: 2-hydroxyacid dehydrogenase [Paracoccaceae bacterium]|nr:2-hydroxyacid dehydrogenase [Paracoccaceae bacterium]MDE2674110.1 2-hydroxyacid dehydrogenase [Paracoccaceae bacterium]